MTININGKRCPFSLRRDGVCSITVGTMVFVGWDICEVKQRAEEYLNDESKT